MVICSSINILSFLPVEKKAVTPHISSDLMPPLSVFSSSNVFQVRAMVTVLFSSPLNLSHSPLTGLPLPLLRIVCKSKSSTLILPNPYDSEHLATDPINFYLSGPRIPFLGRPHQSSVGSPAFPVPSLKFQSPQSSS